MTPTEGGSMARATVFSRGSSVLDYWLAHAEGLTVRPLDAVVEQVVARPPSGRAETLIVRPRGTRRLREIPAAEIAAVEPATQSLLLERRVGPKRVRRAARSGARMGGTFARHCAADFVVGARLVGVGALIVGRGSYRAGARGRAALDAWRERRSRSQPAQ
jgi:hypothetical protein